MIATLPGIDPNDVPKAMFTFEFLTVFCTLIPITNCSSAPQFHSDLTEHERTICSQTAQFEDFVAQYLDRCFVIIESSAMTQTREENANTDLRSTRQESRMDMGLVGVLNSIVQNCSSEIYDMAMKKVQNFVRGRILETKAAGRIAANICR